MKKILIALLMVLLVILAYFAIFKGISIGKFQVLSVKQIETENNKLTEAIGQSETLMHSTYRSKTDELESSVDGLLIAKEEYLDLADVSTQKDLQQANKEETYRIEYLWTRIGSHATSEGVDLKLDILPGETGDPEVKNLSFTVTGNYIAVINFVISIEDDSQLGFRIENFKILPGGGDNGRQATFTIRNVRIKQENTAASDTAQSNTSTNNNGQNEINTTNNTQNQTNINNNEQNQQVQTNTTTNTDTQATVADPINDVINGISQ